ncbi:acid phosphatase [Methylobacterium durans]|uniref:Acid phosphatase n=1 Tax=Methylobacterium durans TaxID=2202825 RepID=A0A2U8W4I8_9HYPH|nr:phosphatase PAP2 family protein [Methylobacterium durans]AWN41014.1 acid phosphatase [Methylobacterium durans]
MPRFLPALATLALLASATGLPAPASAQDKAAPSVGTDTLKPGAPAHQPYLTDALVPDTVAILPPPPASHSAAEAADRAAFNATRALKGTTRWELAAADVAEGAAAILDNFACVLGTKLDQARVPTLMTLLERARLDIARGTRGPKVHYRRLRPFVGNEAPICVQRTQQLTDSYSYPSGHASQGWAYALIMASLVPEKASAILVRGRAYGESRVVCGVHWMSDVEAGRTNGAAIVAALQANATFRADLERARADLGKAMASGGPVPDQAHCAREEAASRMPEL